jgi:hypothetical protein
MARACYLAGHYALLDRILTTCGDKRTRQGVFMGLMKDVGATLLRMAAASLLIMVVPRLLVRWDKMEWRKLDYVPYALALYASVELLLFVFRHSRRRRESNDQSKDCRPKRYPRTRTKRT